MPVSTDCLQPPAAKRCKYCDESTHGVDGPLLWRLTLDQDLLDTLTRRFPSWFDNNTTQQQQSNNTDFVVTNSEKLFSVNLMDLNEMAEGDNSLVNSTAPSGRPLLNITETIDGSSSSSSSCSSSTSNAVTSRQSPPKAVVDSSPLQPAMDKNKESLKVKLMVRRPLNQLVEQGIIPPLKTSPALHEQRKQLERAKTGDLLRAKIQQRPDRQELERRHILEHDESHVDPSLAEKQRMLKKARLADQLNSQISHRPGPLELIKKNILHTEEPIERIVKEGLVSFKATSEGLLNRPQQPNGYVTYEDDSQSSEGDQRTTPPRSDVIEAAAASAGIVTVALTIPTSGGAVVVTSPPVLQTKFHPTTIVPNPYVPPPPPPPPPVPIIKSEPIHIKSETSNLFAELCQSVVGNSNLLPLVPSPVSLSSTTSTLSPLSSIASPPSASSSFNNNSISSRQLQSPHPNQNHKSDAPGKDKNRKKCKVKPVTKARTIKFHEYKGPPNAHKSSTLQNSTNEETSYQLLLKQQNCLLEYLEGLNKHPTTVLLANSKTPNEINSFQQSSNSYILQPIPSPAPSISSSIPASPAPSFTDSISSELSKLEKMKVSDLKVLLKKRNLPVSGPKPQLIERLKPYLPLEGGDTSSTSETSISGETCDMETLNSPHHSLSPESEHEFMDIQHIDSPAPVEKILPPSFTNDELLREQQRKIDDLQKKLKESQEQLLHMRQNQNPSTVVFATSAGPSDVLSKPPEVINQKLVFKQQLEAKIQKEKLQQLENQQRLQREHLAFQQAKNQGNLMLRTQSPVLIAPKEDKSIQLAFNKTQSTTPLANKKNVEILWNGEPTLFLVGLDNKRIINTVPTNATTMPGILVPITTAPPPPPLPPMTAIINKLNLQQHHQQQQNQPPPSPLPSQSSHHLQQTRIAAYQVQPQQQQQQHHLTQTRIPPPPHPPLQPIKIEIKPPPPQYEEATKQIENNRKDRRNSYSNSSNNSNSNSNSNNNKSSSSNNKSSVKSQVMTDVLEILIKNGELPETAVFDPTTPTTPTTPERDAVMAQTICFNDRKLSLNSTQQKQQQQQQQPTPPPPPKLLAAIPAPASPSMSSISATKLILDTTHNVEMLSPMQPDDCDNSVNSFDMFLEQHGHDDESNCVNPESSDLPNVLTSQHPTNVVDLKPFDDLELMELMGHHLDMDIGDDSCNQLPPATDHIKIAPIATGLINTSAITKSSRRDMNPSLQPSLNELIQQQQLQNGLTNNYNNNYNTINSSTTIIAGNNSNHNNNNNNTSNNNNNISNNNNNTGSNNIHFNSTPMDIEDFENSLSAFDFSALTCVPDEPINTPPHPFSSLNHQQSQQPQQHQQQNHHHHDQHNHQYHQSPHSTHSLTHDSFDNNDSHCYDPPLGGINHENILDMFSIDDFKMANDTLSWNEVDFAV